MQHPALAPLATWQTSPSLLYLHALAIQTEMEQRLESDLSLNVKVNVNVMRFSGFGDQVLFLSLAVAVVKTRVLPLVGLHVSTYIF